jgi:hypothetical protein
MPPIGLRMRYVNKTTMGIAHGIEPHQVDDPTFH